MLEAAFCDFRRFSRVRLLHCAAEDIRKTTPLVENGPDPNTDKDIVTSEWLEQLCQRKRAPIKAVLLDQANISGIGNWVGDEVLFQSRIHPEQYAHTLSKVQISELHKQLMEVVRIAIETKSDSDLFPESWLFKHRWGKGRKAVHQMPNGEKITFLTVGGRTSAIVPTLQKKTGPVAGDVNRGDDQSAGGKANGKGSEGKRKKVEADEDEEDEDVKVEADAANTTRRKVSIRGKSSKGKRPSTAVVPDDLESEHEEQDSPSEQIKDEEESRLDQLPPTAPAEDITLQISNSIPTRRGRKSNSTLSKPLDMEDTKLSSNKSNSKHHRNKTDSAATIEDTTSIQQSQINGTPSKKRKLEEVVGADTTGRRRSQRFAKA